MFTGSHGIIQIVPSKAVHSTRTSFELEDAIFYARLSEGQAVNFLPLMLYQVSSCQAGVEDNNGDMLYDNNVPSSPFTNLMSSKVDGLRYSQCLHRELSLRPGIFEHRICKA